MLRGPPPSGLRVSTFRPKYRVFLGNMWLSQIELLSSKQTLVSRKQAKRSNLTHALVNLTQSAEPVRGDSDARARGSTQRKQHITTEGSRSQENCDRETRILASPADLRNDLRLALRVSRKPSRPPFSAFSSPTGASARALQRSTPKSQKSIPSELNLSI